MSRSIFYYDKEKGEIVEGYPPRKYDVYGQAPGVIQDSITPYYHPAACVWTESRKTLNDLDKATGCFTTDKLQRIPENFHEKKKAQAEKDRSEALQKAVAQYKSGTTPFNEEQKQFFKKQDEALSKQWGWDVSKAFDKPKTKRSKKKLEGKR